MAASHLPLLEMAELPSGQWEEVKGSWRMRVRRRYRRMIRLVVQEEMQEDEREEEELEAEKRVVGMREDCEGSKVQVWRTACVRGACKMQIVSLGRSVQSNRDVLCLDPLPVLRLFLVVAELDFMRCDLFVPNVTRVAAFDVSQIASEDERGEVGRVEDRAGDGEDGAVGRS